MFAITNTTNAYALAPGGGGGGQNFLRKRRTGDKDGDIGVTWDVEKA